MINKRGENYPVVPFLTLGSSCKPAFWCHPLLLLSVSELERNIAKVARSIPRPKNIKSQTENPRGSAKRSPDAILKVCQSWQALNVTDFQLCANRPKSSGEGGPGCAKAVTADLISVNESMFLFGSNNR